MGSLTAQAAAEANWAATLAAERLVVAAEAERLAARVEEKVRPSTHSRSPACCIGTGTGLLASTVETAC
jgi:hypothetical protein